MNDTSDARTGRHRLEHFPVSIFAMAMGLGGFAIATHELERVLKLTGFLSTTVTIFTLSVFTVIGFFYLLKAFRHSDAVAAEWAHPVTISYFPAITIALIILSICFLTVNARVSALLWWIGAPLNIAATFAVVSTWINTDRYEAVHLNPAWFIPVVGNVLAPIAGVHHAPLELNWFFFSVGILFWLMLLAIVLNRLVFHHPLPDRLVPTLFILIAPPSAGFLAYMKLTGAQIDPAARLLYYIALFFFILMLLQARKLVRLEFSLSWWAYSFPLAVLTIATFTFAKAIDSLLLGQFGLVVYGLLTLVIAVLLIRTILAIKNHRICEPE